MTGQLTNNQQAPNVSRDEQIGFHKGALATLAKEREEMGKIIQIVEQLMQMHIKALKEQGVDLQAQAEAMQQKQQAQSQAKPKGTSKPIDDMLR